MQLVKTKNPNIDDELHSNENTASENKKDYIGGNSGTLMPVFT